MQQIVTGPFRLFTIQNSDTHTSKQSDLIPHCFIGTLCRKPYFTNLRMSSAEFAMRCLKFQMRVKVLP